MLLKNICSSIATLKAIRWRMNVKRCKVCLLEKYVFMLYIPLAVQQNDKKKTTVHWKWKAEEHFFFFVVLMFCYTLNLLSCFSITLHLTNSKQQQQKICIKKNVELLFIQKNNALFTIQWIDDCHLLKVIFTSFPFFSSSSFNSFSIENKRIENIFINSRIMNMGIITTELWWRPCWNNDWRSIHTPLIQWKGFFGTF